MNGFPSALNLGSPSPDRSSKPPDGFEVCWIVYWSEAYASRMADISGPELRVIVEKDGWEGVMEKMGANLEELQQLQMKDPVGWEQFKESQLAARANRDAPRSLG